MANHAESVLRRPVWNYLAIFFHMQISLMGSGFSRWGAHFLTNRWQIAELTVVNAVLVTGMEFAGRTLSHQMFNKSDERAFFVNGSEGGTRINRQSLINILMTIIGSLLGGPAYFFRRRSLRLLFFSGFALFNGILGQIFASAILGGGFFLEGPRLLFDIFYATTFKFGIFEFLRGPIIRSHGKIHKVAFLRFNHKFWSTFFKVQLVDLLGLKG